MKRTKHLAAAAVMMCLILTGRPDGIRAETNLNMQMTALPAGVSIHQLDNGLQVLLIENPGLPMTGVNVVVKTGSAYESFSSSGMSHMLEHLLFNGTETRTQKELYDQVDLIGGYNNANTGTFHTNYMMVTPAENIRKGMEIQADMLFKSILPEEKFEKEKGIVLEEIARSLENANEQMERNIQSVLYPNHALSLPTLGTYATIQFMKRDEVYAYYKNHYVPNNMIMSVVGNFKTESMLKQIKEIYGVAQPRGVAQPLMANWVTGFEKPSQPRLKPGSLYHRSYKGDKPVLQLFYGLPSEWQDSHFTLFDEILKNVTDGLKEKLAGRYPDIERKLTYETRRSPENNFLQISMILDDAKQVGKTADDINTTLGLFRFSLNNETVQNLATQTRTTFLKNIEKPHMFGIFNAHQFAVGGIESVLASYATGDYPQAAKEISSYKPDLRVTVLQYPATAESADAQIAESKAEIKTDTQSGITIIADQNPASDLLAIHFMIMHKAQFEQQFGKDAAKILHDCLGQRLESEKNQKITKQFGLTYTVNDNPFIPMDNIYLHPDFSYIRVEGLADDIPGVVGFLKEQLTNFTPTEDEFNKAFAKSQRPMMGMGSSKTGQLFEDTYTAEIYEADKYGENSKVLTYESLVKFADDFFNPANMIVSVVSPASAAQIFDLFSWDAVPAAMVIKDKAAYERPLKLHTVPVVKELSGDGERSYLFWGFSAEVDKADKPALQALGLLLADKIVFEVREKQGRAYRMRAGLDLVNDRVLFYMNLGTRPENIDPLLAQVAGFFTEGVVNSFNEFDLEKSINMYLGRMMFRRLSSINKAFYLAQSQYFFKDLSYDSQFLSDLKQVKLADVKRVAKTYMKADNPVTVIVR